MHGKGKARRRSFRQTNLKGSKLWTQFETIQILPLPCRHLLNWLPMIGMGRAMTRIPKMAQTAPTRRPSPVMGTTCICMYIYIYIHINIYTVQIYYMLISLSVIVFLSTFVFSLKAHLSISNSGHGNESPPVGVKHGLHRVLNTVLVKIKREV